MLNENWMDKYVLVLYRDKWVSEYLTADSKWNRSFSYLICTLYMVQCSIYIIEREPWKWVMFWSNSHNSADSTSVIFSLTESDHLIEFQCMTRWMFDIFCFTFLFSFLSAKKHYGVRLSLLMHGLQCTSYFILFSLHNRHITDGPLHHYINSCLILCFFLFFVAFLHLFIIQLMYLIVESWLWLRQVLMLSILNDERRRITIIQKPSEHRRWNRREERKKKKQAFRCYCN